VRSVGQTETDYGGTGGIWWLTVSRT